MTALYIILMLFLMVGAFLLRQFTGDAVLFGSAVLAALLTVGYVKLSGGRRAYDKRLRELIDHSAAFVTDEEMTPTERELLLHLKSLETREKKLADCYSDLSSLAADIAHQCKTPLSSILMYAETLGCEPLSNEVERLRFLLDALTRLAKCECGLISGNLRPGVSDVNELICAAVGGVLASADSKETEITCDLPELKARFDHRWTVEALSALLENAVKYSPRGSVVEVSAVDLGMSVRIDVADRGPGVADEDVCNIWKRFGRGKNAAGDGVGIGLYLASQILNAEGGRISVAKREGGGSVFSVFLSKP